MPLQYLTYSLLMMLGSYGYFYFGWEHVFRFDLYWYESMSNEIFWMCGASGIALLDYLLGVFTPIKSDRVI